MKEQTSVEVLVPREMSPDQRQRLIDEIYGFRRLIFEGAQREKSFSTHVIDAGAEHGAVVVHRGAGGQITSYFAVQIIDPGPSGVQIAIFRGESGALGEHAGGDVVLRHVLSRLIRYMLAHPGRPVYCLCSLAHPSSYALFSRFVDITRANPPEGTPAGADDLMSGLAASFDLKADDRGSPFVFEVGQTAAEPPAGCDFLHLYENPSVRYSLLTHLGPEEGHGLITLVPLSLGGMMRAAARCSAPEARRL
ncbi:hypothetical protein WME79_48110 [Sorangium sp. So ce726]|uniref:hypothetical protein n=1 Tax=Sorangium sp. So ce726 TaxID=3133319 RepID=UPI003F618D77